MAKALHIEPAPEAARFITEVIRVVYANPEGANARSDAFVARLIGHMRVVTRFQRALAQAQPAEQAGLSLSLASDKADRARLKDFLELVGLKLREMNQRMTVEPADGKDAAERLRLFSDLRIDIGDLSERLNRGGTVRVDVPSEPVPVPLSVTTWAAAVFQKPLTADGLLAAIMTDRNAALLCHGLAALDDSTLSYLTEHPAVLTDLYEHDAGGFAAFGGALRVADGRVVIPGGPVGQAVWEGVLDEKSTRVDRFVHELFSRSEGRIAYVYDTISRLDAATQAFALGAWIPDAGHRIDRFKALLATAEAYTWSPRLRPFHRPATDFAELAVRVRVEPDGAPSAPASHVLWTRVFEGAEPPDDPAKELRNLDVEGSVDAAWLTERFASEPILRQLRLDQFAFGQRVFSTASRDALPDVLVALRAFERYRMLMLTIERLGIRTPSVYATAARQAMRLGSLDANRGFYALAQYQGAAALLTRLAQVHSIDPPTVEALMASLTARAVDASGWYAGAIARWLDTDLRRALVNRDGNIDRSLVAALAGLRIGNAGPPVRVIWEDQAYRLDFVTPEVKRLRLVLEKLGAVPVRRALELERIAALLTRTEASLADVQTAAADLKTLLAAFPAETKIRAILPPGVDEPRPASEIVGKALEELSRISKAQQLRRGSRVAASLRELADRSLAESLLALTYALYLGPPDGSTLLGGNVSLRHDFGLKRPDPKSRIQTPWAQGTQVIMPNVPWHVIGSLLSLDVALPDLSIRRTALKRPVPILSSNDRDSFIATVPLLDPQALTDADRDVIVATIDRGRARVAGLVDNPSEIDGVAADIRMDGWRRRALGWTIVNAPNRIQSLFSLAELQQLGGLATPAGSQDAWGVAATASTGCLCTRMPRPGQWPMLIGRPHVGLLATQIADLNLRTAAVLAELKLPAALLRDVVAGAVQDMIAELHPLDGNDWLAMVRTLQSLSRERIEDYVAALTASGPLVPEAAVSEAP